MQALQEGSREACASLLQGCRTHIVKSIAAISSESTASINPAVVQLQMLAMLGESWELRWHTSLHLHGELCGVVGCKAMRVRNCRIVHVLWHFFGANLSRLLSVDASKAQQHDTCLMHAETSSQSLTSAAQLNMRVASNRWHMRTASAGAAWQAMVSQGC